MKTKETKRTMKEKRYFLNGNRSCGTNIERIFGEGLLLSLNLGLNENGFTEKQVNGNLVRCELVEVEIPGIEERMESLRY